MIVNPPSSGRLKLTLLYPWPTPRGWMVSRTVVRVDSPGRAVYPSAVTPEIRSTMCLVKRRVVLSASTPVWFRTHCILDCRDYLYESFIQRLLFLGDGRTDFCSSLEYSYLREVTKTQLSRVRDIKIKRQTWINRIIYSKLTTTDSITK